MFKCIPLLKIYLQSSDIKKQMKNRNKYMLKGMVIFKLYG